MGYAKWSNQTYSHLRNKYQSQSRDDIFRQNQMGRVSEKMNPFGLTYRESRDSATHPNALAIGIFLDVTGSMGRIPELLVRHKLGKLMDTLLQNGVQDPQVMFSAIGDQYTDRAPLQVGQFESGAIEMNQDLSSLYLEGGGGGQARESYQLAWLVGARHTSIDCFEKRGQKGFLFTVGDEMSWDTIDPAFLQQTLGYRESVPLQVEDLLAEVQRKYHVYHIHINETSYRNNPQVLNYWRNLLGEHFLILDNYQVLAELIAAVIAIQSGVDQQDIYRDFDPKTRASIQKVLPTGKWNNLKKLSPTYWI